MKRDCNSCSNFKSPDGHWGHDSDDHSSITWLRSAIKPWPGGKKLLHFKWVEYFNTKY